MKDKKTDSNDGISEELLFRYFANKTSIEEKQLIENWRNKSPDNTKEFNEVKIFYKDALALKSIFGREKLYDKGEAWRKFQRANHLEKKASNFRQYFQWAAGVILFCTVGILIYQNHQPTDYLVVSASEIISTQLVDGSSITLNDGSTLTYPEKFSQKERRVVLTGEAYFEIKKDSLRAFIVEMKDAEIEVLGTSFNVSQNNDFVKVTVDEGSVRMSYQKQEVNLEAGTFGVIDYQKNKLDKQEIKISTHQFWRTKRLVFKYLTLKEVMEALEEVYNVNIVFNNKALQNCTITVEFKDESIANIMKIISTTLGIKITHSHNQFIIDGKNVCNH